MNRFRSLKRGAPDWLALSREMIAQNAKWPSALKPIPEADWPPAEHRGERGKMVAAWRSNRFLVRAFAERAGIVRLVINRCEVGIDQKWRDGITWDEIQLLKAEAGFGDRWAAELYPPDAEIVNETNTRHVWLLPRRPAYGLKRRPQENR